MRQVSKLPFSCGGLVHRPSLRAWPQGECQGGGGEGEVAEEDVELGEVEGDDAKKEQGGEGRWDADTPAREEPERDNYLEHAEGVQESGRRDGQPDLCWQRQHEGREVRRPRDRVRECCIGWIDEGEGKAEAEREVSEPRLP